MGRELDHGREQYPPKKNPKRRAPRPRVTRADSRAQLALTKSLASAHRRTYSLTLQSDPIDTGSPTAFRLGAGSL